MKDLRKAIFSLAASSALLLCTAPMSAFAQKVSVDDAWVRATVAQQRASGAFMKITAPSAMKLVGVHSPVASIVEIHEMTMVGDLMKMRAVKAIDLPANKPVALEPGGYHVMLIDLKNPIKDGESVPITLVFEGADGKQVTQEISARARPLNAKNGGGMDPSMQGKGHKH